MVISDDNADIHDMMSLRFFTVLLLPVAGTPLFPASIGTLP
ncbi:hypothetical protein [Stenotrophomonas sp. NRRL B-14846]